MCVSPVRARAQQQRSASTLSEKRREAHTGVDNRELLLFSNTHGPNRPDLDSVLSRGVVYLAEKNSGLYPHCVDVARCGLI